MAAVVGVMVSDDPAERRVPLVPDVARKLAGLGVQLVMQRGAAARAPYPEDDYPDVTWVDSAAEVAARADLLWVLGPPPDEVLATLRPGTVLVGLLQPYASAERIRTLQERQVTAFAMELLPRISRAQSMDVLSSQGAASGYQGALIAASLAPKFFPMLTYAAGTIRPARALVVGAGVAGLQAIATARRLGAIVEAYDVRPETREQIESLGAKFVDTGIMAAGTGGYARELTEGETAAQAAKLARAVAGSDVIVTTAAIPGRRAPVIVTAAMLAGMKPGSVVVDLAAETGGNVEGTVADQEVVIGGVRVAGPTHLPSRMPVHTSEMYAKNLLNFVAPFVRDGELSLDWQDEVLAGTALTHAGAVVNDRVRQALALA
ncbi:NAD(P) transhydrogenase subunit alpha [Deinococcus metalli]|uniref:proton-translocating NAD(P)(+) transhydrogenase n=1 Tax=Deinococcus metalli TaxID=1141878 RepID=A0A7W8NRW3_9DEIO|nr:NAD(P) transhydrogenase subunit alpha [Deinococcus metalli]MBB5378290.1 NAD(P) transhydrogenase subunit alpha [Deinococcus metalli]GHF57457.1 NAD(P) transhydrogenase subunit alpha [Deinococcus metalli]